MPKLSVIIITLNEEANILRSLESAKPVADEIIVVDSLSADHTVDICRNFGCKVFLRKFDGYGPQKEYAVQQASNDWIMYLDADEVLTAELQQELCGLFTPPGSSSEALPGPAPSRNDPTQISGFYVQSSLCYMGKILRFGGVGKEFHLRLFNRTKGGFTNEPVHEGIEVEGVSGNLKGRVIHYSYRSISHHLEKINMYASLAADGYIARGRTFSRFWVVVKLPVNFISFYILKGGFLDGYPGFMWSFMATVYNILKMAKTIEKSRETQYEQTNS